MATKKFPLKDGDKVLDYRGQELAVGDTVVYATSASNNVCIHEGRIVDIYKVDPHSVWRDEPDEAKAEPRLTVETPSKEGIWERNSEGINEFKGHKTVMKKITIQVIRRVVKVPPLDEIRIPRY